MGEKGKRVNQSLQEIWISRAKKEVFLSEVREYERMEFKRYEELMEYVRACIECGYKVG